jgi:adenylate kinase
MRVLILGVQGSGKGTQAKLVAEELGIQHVATGDILRAAIAEGTGLGVCVQPILERGDLVPDDVMVELIRERLATADGFVLDGFPRTLAQAEALDEMLASIGKPLDVVLLLQVSDPVAIGRVVARAELEGRTDDTPEVIENRVRLYHQLTEPVVERYRSRGIVTTLDGERTVDVVFAQVRAALAASGARA